MKSKVNWSHLHFYKCLLSIGTLAFLAACNPTSSEDPGEELPISEETGLSEQGTSSQVGISSLGVISSGGISSQIANSSNGQVSSVAAQSSGVQSSAIVVSSQAQASSAASGNPCFDEFTYKGGAGYPGGSKVSYNGHNYQNIYWASDVTTPDNEQAWTDLGTCGGAIVSSQANQSSAVQSSQVQVSSSQVVSSSSQVQVSSSVQVSSQVQISSSQQVSSSSQDSSGDLVAGWFSESDFNTVFPNRNSFYTWDAFVEAFGELQSLSGLGDFTQFLKEGSQTVREREAAAFFANIVQETGTGTWDSGLHHIVETCAADGSPSGNCVGYGSQAPNYYYGRGPMQLSWNYNYQAFSESYYGTGTTLLNNPSMVQNDAKVAWLAAMWFWNRSDESWSNPPPTIHDVMVSGASYNGSSGFGGTIKAINGGLECPSSGNSKAQKRISFYASMQTAMGLSQDSQNLNCF